MVSPFTDNPEKCVVREQWDTPLLEHLHKTHGVRYRYLGLPGTDLIDVKLWRNMIDEVIAFEPPDKDGYGREAITALTRNMRIADIPGRAYCGSFEEVVLLRRDFDGQDYDQGGLVTLYNLDFCDQICSPIQTQEGDERVWRFHAIRRILQDQLNCYQSTEGPRHFILMLTVRNQIGARKIRKYLRPSTLQGDAKAFYRECTDIKPIPNSGAVIGSHSWALKALLHNMLCSYFGNPNLSALFFPQVLYQGTRVHIPGTRQSVPSPMLHWLVLCRFGDDTAPSPDFWPDQYLARASVAVRDRNALAWTAETGEETPAEESPNAVEWLAQHGRGILTGLRRS